MVVNSYELLYSHTDVFLTQNMYETGRQHYELSLEKILKRITEGMLIRNVKLFTDWQFSSG